MQELDHKHLLLNADFYDSPPSDPDFMNNWLEELVVVVDMKILDGPFAVRCDTLGNEGMTGGAIIETSHITYHIWETAPIPFLRFDLYSCKRFDIDRVFEHFQKLPNIMKISWTYIDRNSEISKTEDRGVVVFKSLVDLLLPEDKIVFDIAMKKRRNKEPRTKEEKIVLAKYSAITSKFSSVAKARYQKYKSEYKIVLDGIKARCSKKGLPFDLDANWYDQELAFAKTKWPKISIHETPDSFWCANVDRIDPSGGYVKQNCRIVPRALNVAKWKWHKSELKELLILLEQEVNLNSEAGQQATGNRGR